MSQTSAPKPSGRRQRRNGPNLTVVGDSGAVTNTPPPPTGVLKVVRDQWEAYWDSPVAQAVDRVTDLPALQRLFTLMDERERAYRGYRKKRLVQGSQGQPVINPLAKVMASLDSEIRQLEDRLGLTPKARAMLGIKIGEAKKSLADLNRDLEVEHD